MERMRCIISSRRISRRVKELGAEIEGDLAGHTPVFIGVLKGSFIFLADLIRAVSLPLEVDFARLSSYGDATRSSGTVRVDSAARTPVEGRHVVVVEDIVDTGLTLQHYLKELKKQRPASLRLCALLHKTERREVIHHIDYLGFTIPSGFVVGYGLDWGERYRNLPAIYRVEGV